MGQAFWTGVRLPSSPPENKNRFGKDFFLSGFLISCYIDKFKYIEYNKYNKIKYFQKIRSW